MRCPRKLIKEIERTCLSLLLATLAWLWRSSSGWNCGMRFLTLHFLRFLLLHFLGCLGTNSAIICSNCFPKIFQDSEHIMYLNTSPHVKLESQIDIKCSVFHRHENMIWISNTHSFHGDKDRMINVSKVIWRTINNLGLVLGPSQPV